MTTKFDVFIDSTFNNDTNFVLKTRRHRNKTQRCFVGSIVWMHFILEKYVSIEDNKATISVFHFY